MIVREFRIPSSWHNCPTWWRNIVKYTWDEYPDMTVDTHKEIFITRYNKIFLEYDACVFYVENAGRTVHFYNETLYIAFLLRWA